MVLTLKNAYIPIAMLIVSTLALAGMPKTQHPSEFVAVLFPPWWTSAQSMIAAAGTGTIAGTSALPFLIVIAPASSGFRTQLYHSGAWLMFDPGLFPICGATATKQRLT